MKWTSAIAIALTAALITAVALFSLLPTGAQSSEATARVAADTAVAEPAGDLARLYQEREAIYQQQIDQLNQALTERQAIYQAQIDVLNSRMATATAAVAQLSAQEQALQVQLDELQAVRNQRQSLVAGQFQEAALQYGQRDDQMAGQLTVAQVRLAEANRLLGR